MRYFLLILFLIPNIAYAEELPDLKCNYLRYITVPYENIFQYSQNQVKRGHAHIFKNKKLYVNDWEKEYLYGDVEEVEGDINRYTSAHKTIVFKDNFSKALVTHVSPVDTKIFSMSCVKI